MRLFTLLVGSADDSTFDQRLYHGICIIVSILLVGLSISNFINQLNFDLIICCIGILSTSVLYYFARFRKKYHVFSLYGLYLFLVVACYFKDNGIYGPMPYGIVVILVFALVFSPIKRSIQIFAFHMLIFLIVLLIEHFFPQLITNPYKSQSILYKDLLVSIFGVIIFSFISIYYLRYIYEQEKKRNLEQQTLLDKTNNEKTMFFINLSHEIKTPLTLIENYIDKYIARKGEDDELIIMRRNIQKLRRNILDYLSIENLERGRFSFDEVETIQFTKFFEEKILLFTPYAVNKNITLNNIIEPDVFIDVNSRGIDQVLNNLLENAVKYTPEFGVINIVLKKEKKSVVFTIQNSGSVIPADQLPHLFEPFYQLSHEKLNAQGVGMGLYIVKKILHNFNGEICVNSNIEQGVVFTVTLPLSIAGKTAIPAVPTKPKLSCTTVVSNAKDSAYFTSRPCLLVVEDNNDLLSYLADELSDNYNVFLASDGLKAIERLETIPLPDLIITDIMMDKLDGHQLLIKTLSDDRFAHIPFIFLTAKSDPKEKSISLEMGALDFISKPFSMVDLKMKIKSIIEQNVRISNAAIRELKEQFTNNNFKEIKQKNEAVLGSNILRYNLSPREKEVLVHLQQGLKYEEIGRMLYISENTVVRHVQNIYKKTEVSSKIELLQKMFLTEVFPSVHKKTT